MNNTHSQKGSAKKEEWIKEQLQCENIERNLLVGMEKQLNVMLT